MAKCVKLVIYLLHVRDVESVPLLRILILEDIVRVRGRLVNFAVALHHEG